MRVCSLISAGSDVKGGWIVRDPALRHMAVTVFIGRRRIHVDRYSMAMCGPVKPLGLLVSIATMQWLNLPPGP